LTKKKVKKNFLDGLLVFFIVVSAVAIVYVLFVQEKYEKKKTGTVSSETKKQVNIQKPISSLDQKRGKQKTVVSKIEKTPLPKKQVAIIIDDIGRDLKPLRELMEIKSDITFSVLPFLPHSREAVEMLHHGGKEILLHLPMEPLSYPDDKPGEGALFTDMNEKELLHQLDKNIEVIPYIAGVNNHMGSKFMMDKRKLQLVFSHLKRKGLFFIDSRTAANSEAIAAAKAVGLPMAERKIFIDNNRDYNEIYKNLMSATNYNNGASPLIIIGHPYPETIRALKDATKELRRKGILIVPVSQIMKAKSDIS